MYTALLQVIIYQLAKYERDPMKNGREIAERRKWERNKRKINKKEKTTQQQKGLPTLSADLNNRKVFRRCRQTLMKGHWREIQITYINVKATVLR